MFAICAPVVSPTPHSGGRPSSSSSQPHATSSATDAAGEDTALNLPTGDPESVQAASGGGLVRTFVGLAIVVAVIYGLYWILRQVKAGREERTVGSGLTTTATVPLGPNRALGSKPAASSSVKS